MKKCLDISLVYAAAAMAGGVFYREFTRINDFDGVTVLGKVHTHLFLLGMIIFLIAALFCAHFKSLTEQKLFKAFLCVYNIGVPITAVMMAVRGVSEVLGTELSKGANGAISGISGIGHIITGTGIILLLVSFRSAAKTEGRK
ncbi:MAG: DUF2871 domain-containing protein [Huintestinicola sp.]|uniref:DUF2871 domain-containing protein n=1 Tax=Huintestinicola sp. TaxID=2981661 RepID=UPI003F0DF567